MVAVYRSYKWYINGPHVDVVIFNIILKATELLLAAYLTFFFLLKFRVYLDF